MAKDKKETEELRSFRVLHGMHREGGRTYQKGETVESASDLNKQNHPTAGKKFEEVTDAPRRRQAEAEPEEDETETEGASPVANMGAPEAIDKISRMTKASVDKLQTIAATDHRSTVREAAEARLLELSQ